MPFSQEMGTGLWAFKGRYRQLQVARGLVLPPLGEEKPERITEPGDWLPQAGRLGRPTLPVHGREDGWSLEMLVLLGSGSKVVSPSSLPWAGIVLICNAVLSVLF